jgi:hypothetical protein
MADGSMPLGDYDAVDPEFAQFDYLPVPNAQEAGDYCIPRAAGIDRSSSENVASLMTLLRGSRRGRKKQE